MRKEVIMRRFAFVAIVLAIALGAGVKWTSARPALQASGELLELLPDGNAVVVVDLHKVMTSSLWSTLSERNEFKNAIGKVDNDISELGLKLTDIHMVAVVFPTAGFNEPTIAVRGTFNQSDLISRLRASQKVKLTSEKYKNQDVYRVQDLAPLVTTKENTNKENKSASKSGDAKPQVSVKKPDNSFTFYDNGTAIIGSQASVHAAIDVRAGGRPTVAQNAKLSEAIGQNPAAAIRFALQVTPSMTSSMQSSGLPLPDFSSVNLIFGAIDFTAGIDLIATLRNDTVPQAEAMAVRLNGLLEMLRGFLGASGDQKMAGLVTALKTVSITSTEADVKITGNLPLEILTQIIK